MGEYDFIVLTEAVVCLESEAAAQQERTFLPGPCLDFSSAHQ